MPDYADDAETLQHLDQQPGRSGGRYRFLHRRNRYSGHGILPSGAFCRRIATNALATTLQEFTELDDTQYRSWLTRSAQEILYWTALQPYEVRDNRAFDPGCEFYSEHLKQTGHLDKTLYPETLHLADEEKKFPRDFDQGDDQLNLRADNAVLPLVRGLTLLANRGKFNLNVNTFRKTIVVTTSVLTIHGFKK